MVLRSESWAQEGGRRDVFQWNYILLTPVSPRSFRYRRYFSPRHKKKSKTKFGIRKIPYKNNNQTDILTLSNYPLTPPGLILFFIYTIISLETRLASHSCLPYNALTTRVNGYHKQRIGSRCNMGGIVELLFSWNIQILIWKSSK